MCGIFGWSFGNPPDMVTRGILGSVLGIANTGRGKDSWGYAWAPGEYEKDLGSAAKGLRGGKLALYPHLIAHTRFRTVGGITKENAHPFHIGHITGAHNGCIWNHEELEVKYGRDFGVDSMHIFAHLSEGLDLSELTGYGAAHWFDDRKPNRVNLGLLTHSGELTVVHINSDGIVGCVWSSDRDHVELALAQAGLTKKTEHSIKVGKLHYVQGGKLYYVDEESIMLSPQRTGTYACGFGTTSTYNGYVGSTKEYTHGTPLTKAERRALRKSKKREAYPYDVLSYNDDKRTVTVTTHTSAASSTTRVRNMTLAEQRGRGLPPEGHALMCSCEWCREIREGKSQECPMPPSDKPEKKGSVTCLPETPGTGRVGAASGPLELDGGDTNSDSEIEESLADAAEAEGLSDEELYTMVQDDPSDCECAYCAEWNIRLEVQAGAIGNAVGPDYWDPYEMTIAQLVHIHRPSQCRKQTCDRCEAIFDRMAVHQHTLPLQ